MSSKTFGRLTTPGQKQRVRHSRVSAWRLPLTNTVDAVGTVHTVAPADARIVSLVPSITELLFALGLGEQVVARTSFCIHPNADVQSVPRIGGTKQPKLEKLRALRPTHVILNVDENRQEDAQALATFVPNLIVTHPLEPNDNLQLYRMLGAIFSRQQHAHYLCEQFNAAMATLASGTNAFAKRNVLYLIWREPWMTVSRSTYISRMLSLINWHTIAHDNNTRYPQIEINKQMLGSVDDVLFSSEPFPFKDKHLEEVRALAAAESSPRLSLVDGEMMSWYGVRAIDGLRYLSSLPGKLA